MNLFIRNVLKYLAVLESLEDDPILRCISLVSKAKISYTTIPILYDLVHLIILIIALPLRDIKSYEKTDFFSYHCDKVRYLKVSAMDPSMVLGFLVRNPSEYQTFLKDVQGV